MTKIEYGTEVQDKNGTVLGKVNHVIRDSWTGEIWKFMVRQEASNSTLFFSPDDVIKEKEPKITIKSASNELKENS